MSGIEFGSKVSLLEFEGLLRRELEPIQKDVSIIKERLFIGTDSQTSMQVEIAVGRAKMDSIIEQIYELKNNDLSHPKPGKRKLPDHFWKAIGVLILALASAIGGVAAQKRSEAPAIEPEQILSARSQSSQ